jgi:23S rRNA (guanine745-N1)-methyltransferase
MTVSNKNLNARAFELHPELLRCPVCSAPMEMVEFARLVCTENHSFDLSKHGYVNLAPQAHRTKYDKALFEARQTVHMSGFFNQMLEGIMDTLAKRLDNLEALTILDAGCGEGSHLATICSRLTASGVGIDLAKEGIAEAARFYPGHQWIVADLANCPFGDETFNVIVNILSPANYAEFERLLKPGGLLVKVIPGKAYLMELREVFYDDDEKEQDAGQLAKFEEMFEAVEVVNVSYSFPLNVGLLDPLIRMTPLSWGASEERVAAAGQMDFETITVDLQIVSGLKK